MSNKNDEKENKNKLILLKIRKFHDYFNSKNFQEKQEINNDLKKDGNIETITKEEDKSDDIYIQYLKNHNIIFQNNNNNNSNLELMFKELDKDIDNGDNIFLPYLDIVEDLVKAYIESDLDTFNISEEGETISEKNITPEPNDSFYQKVFQKIKYNCFINKEVLRPIYEYFSNLYDKVHEIKEVDHKLLQKFLKMMKLFRIFYEKDKGKNESSICSIGGNLKIDFNNKKIKLYEGYQISITVNILNYYLDDLNKNLYVLKVNGAEEKYESLLTNIIGFKLKSIVFSINSKLIFMEYKTEKRDFTISQNVKLDQISEISILEKFTGQISSINVSIGKDGNIIEYNYLPISIRNENKMYYYKKTNKADDPKEIQDIIPRIIIENKNLVKINYLNYCDKKFDIIDYFGGIIQFLPFYHIFKELKKINEITSGIKESLNNESLIKSIEITTIKKLNEYIANFASFIINLIIKKLFLTENKIKYFKKYFAFIFYLILNSELDITIINEFEAKKDINKKINLYSYLNVITMIYYNIKNAYSFDSIDEIRDLISNDNLEEVNFNIIKMPKTTFNHLYTKYMKKLFVFNGFWSKKNIFYKKENENKEKTKEIKYKQINYYTKNFQLPYFYPILEISKYYPKFSKLKEGIFLGYDKDILEYNFELIEKIKYKNILNAIIKNKEKNNICQECCLVKNTHHINGELEFLKKKDYNKNKKFHLIFRQKETNYKTCNNNFSSQEKNQNEIESGSNKESLCYGSVFPCPKKESNKAIIIKSKDILFLLFRVYFHRVSGIEIFTINNKSYYFNFFEQFEVNNLKKNKIPYEIKSNGYFKEIKMKKDKLILGLYNSIYESYLFPLFKEEINVWDKKIKYLNNYDLITLVNFFSNRSFKDVYQYPIFPTLYGWINQKRDMGEHIGFQEILDESKERKDIIIKTFDIKEDDEEDLADSEKEEKYLFNIHYSNPAFIFNYLLRVLPYSFLAVEFQGDNFDNSNRLFYSVEKALTSTLSLKSDLREMIPELFYMIELFYNKTNLFLDKLNDGSNIDYVDIIPKHNKELTTEEDKKENMAMFISEMRQDLEEENDVDKWINIIFGNKQKYTNIKGKNYQNYQKSSEIHFKNDKTILNNSYYMELADFGLLPFQLFKKDFPSRDIKDKTKIKKEIKELNSKLFKEDHINEIFSPIDCFICRGSTLLNNNYIKIIDSKEKLNTVEYFEFPNKYIQKFNENILNNQLFVNTFGDIEIDKNKKSSINSSFNNYYFVGDFLGNIDIYSVSKKNKNKNEEEDEEEEEKMKVSGSFEVNNDEAINFIQGISSNELNNKNAIYYNKKKKGNILPVMKNDKSIFDFELKKINKLNDHSKEIKYIDFNPRLNILLSYSLDNYINIYIFPKLKLINVIDTRLFKDKKDSYYFDEVVAISYPFPMIICHNKENIYILTINGELIKKENLDENHKIAYYIDKNLGLYKDLVEITDSKGRKHYCNFITNI